MSEIACFLPDEGLIHLRGNNIAVFLQGQLTCDTRALNATTAILGALCTVQGRVISDLTVLEVNDSHCLLRLRADLARSVAETLQRYAQFSRITVTAEDADECIAGGYSPEPAETAANAPLSPLPVVAREGLLRLQRGDDYWEYIAPDATARSALRAQVADSRPGEADIWRSRALRRGHYALQQIDSGLFTPQALNFDRTGLVSFRKGCYTGQEVVARLHYKGRSKRRLGVFFTNADPAQLPRDRAVLDENGVTCGRLLRAERGGAAALVAAEVLSEQVGHALRLDDGTPLLPASPSANEAGGPLTERIIPGLPAQEAASRFHQDRPRGETHWPG